ncbi:MAG: hypothetical protein E7170_00040 [Firmicutes bacterium]|nr:hypothetical protein [Bacillota bacterium]
MIEELNKGIEVSKNLLETLPKNNIKNKEKYKQTLIEVKNKYDECINVLLKEINRRKNKYSNVIEDETIEIKKNELDKIKEKLYLLNEYNSAYEKFGFDKILYEIDHFYKEDLNKSNLNILECIGLFKNVGIKLSDKDFNYSKYAKEYMGVLLEDEEKIKECFEQIYWQCPDLFKHIELNIKNLYYKNQMVFEKYIQKEKQEFINNYRCDVLSLYKEKYMDYKDLIDNSLYIGLNKFLNKELNINDFQLNKVEKYYEKFTLNAKENFDKVNEEIKKYSLSTIEYKNYLYFNYIIDDLKTIYNEKDKYKNGIKLKLKEIQKKENELFKYNKKKSKEKINVKISNLIIELEKLYKELDEITFCDRVSKFINDDSSIYDSLALASSHYLYIVKCMKKNEKDGDFNLEHNKLIEFILNNENNIIKNISIIEQKDIPLIISDRYKLSNFNITKDNLESIDGIEDIINTADKIDIYNKIVLKLSYDNIKYLVDVKDMFKN